MSAEPIEGEAAAAAAAAVRDRRGTSLAGGVSTSQTRLQHLLQLYPLSRLEDLPNIVDFTLAGRGGPIQADCNGLVESIGQHFPLVGIKGSVDLLIKVLSRMHRTFVDSNRDPSLFLEGLHLLRVVGCPGTGKSTLLRCIWGLLLHRIQEVRESDNELWEQWKVWQVDGLEDRILSWNGRPWVYLLSMEESGMSSLTQEEQELSPSNCLALRMLFGVVGRLYNNRYDNFVQQLDTADPELLGLWPLDVINFVEAVYGSGSNSKKPSMAVWAFDDVNQAPDISERPTWFQQQLCEAVAARESAVYSRDCSMMPVFITAGTRGSAVSLLKTAIRKARIKDLRLAAFSDLREQQLMVMDVIRRLPWPANTPRPESLPGPEGSLSSLGKEQQQQLLQCCPAVLTELLQWCGNLFRAVEYAFAMCGGGHDGKHFRISSLPQLMADGSTGQAEEILRMLSASLAESSNWARYCSAPGQNHELMLRVFAYSITCKPVSRCTMLRMPGIDSVAGGTQEGEAIYVQDLEADGLVLLVSRHTMLGSDELHVSDDPDFYDFHGDSLCGDVAPDSLEEFAITLPPVMMLMLQQQLEAQPGTTGTPQGWAAIPLLQQLADLWRHSDITGVPTLALRLQLYREVFQQRVFRLRDLHPGFCGGPCDVLVITPKQGYTLTPTPAGAMTPGTFEEAVAAATAEANWLFVGPSNSGPAGSWVVLLEADFWTWQATGRRVVINIQSKLGLSEDRISSAALIQEVQQVPMLQQKDCMQAFLYVSDLQLGKGLQNMSEPDVDMQPSPQCGSQNPDTQQQLQLRWRPQKRAAVVLRDGKEMTVVCISGAEQHMYRGAVTMLEYAVQRLQKQKLEAIAAAAAVQQQ